MRLLFVLAIFVFTFVATAKKEEKRQINQFLHYYGPTEVIEPRRLRPTITITTTTVLTATYMITCMKSTTPCTTTPSPSTSTATPSTSTSTTTPSTSTSTTTPSTSTSTTTPSTSTSTTTPSNSTSTTTPSNSTSSAGRRRRHIDNIDNLEAQDWVNEQLSIAPSNVQGVEATLDPVREGRAAHPQLFSIMSPFGYYHPQEIQPGFNNDPTISLPYYGSFAQPAPMGHPRIFFGGFFNSFFPAIPVTKTETFTSVAITIATSTSSQVCTTPGLFLQCLP